ncbi:unnamed protein product, partial [Porites lobata]
KEAYWICLAFLIYDDLKKKNPTSVQENQTLSFCVHRSPQYESRGYWLWHDLLDILDLLAPYEQDWLVYPQQERERNERAILHLNEFCKTCWYWLDLLINRIDKVDRF